jgi:hypothetical protein
MTYKAKKITPSINRRISISFRECDLKGIFETNISKTKQLVEALDQMFKMNSQFSTDSRYHAYMKGLVVSLEIYLKCLTYDFLAILLNETQDEEYSSVRNPFSIFAHPLMR